MSDIEPEKLLGIFPLTPKALTTNVIECKCVGEGKSTTAIAIIFDDGHTEIRCPEKKNCQCCYEELSQSTRKKGFWNKTYQVLKMSVTILVGLIILAVLVSDIFQRIKTMIG
jgi:hypothetical protein